MRHWLTAFQTSWEGITTAGNPIPNIHNTSDLDTWAQHLEDAMITATKASMPKRRTPPTKPAPWWNSDCQEAAQALRHAAISNDNAPSTANLANALRQSIREAKRSWATDTITNSKHADIWDIAKWSTG
ncbi:hypothetical protein H0H81_002327 [Sphagnurus paluster]|uniref:Uncharacterized protein n=1 Tax=Sphagnurus paluster TaxID=117069 RepID=A0A9P7GLY2_9AGAR|nr:hypothetical protein H0H81_002327 [Sphagnurus paluster]